MIKYTEVLELPIPADQLLSHLRNLTVQPYRPFSCGYTHSYELQSLPDFRLIEGVVVPPHSDGIAGYRPILMLHNPSNNYIIRGCGGSKIQALSAQTTGTLVVLDIDMQHEAHSVDPNGGHGPWSGLVWGINGQPFMHEECNVEQVAELARQEFLRLCKLRLH